jgi:hypothetical protein
MGIKTFGFGDDKRFTTEKRTRCEHFLAEMEALVPWKRLIDLIEPTIPGSARTAVGLPIRCRPCSGSPTVSKVVHSVRAVNLGAPLATMKPTYVAALRDDERLRMSPPNLESCEGAYLINVSG